MRAVNFETIVLVQDLVIQWLQPYPCKAKSQGVFFFLQSLYINVSVFRNKCYCRTGGTQCEKEHPRYFNNQVKMKSGGLIPWSVCCCFQNV